MCFENPQVPSEGSVLRGQLKMAPQLLAADQQYAPAFNQLQLQNLSSYLTGTSGNTTGGLAGMLANYVIPGLTNATNAANTSTRTSTIADATNMAPAVNASIRASDPTGANLLDSLNSSVGNELSYGTQLTPAERLQLDQSVRGGQAARGMGNGPSDVFNESLADTDMGQQLLGSRQGAAQSLVGTNQGFWGDALSRLTGITGTAGGTATGSIAGLAQNGQAPANLSLFDPNSPASQQQVGLGFQSSEDAAMNNNHWVGAVDTLGSNMSSY